MPISPSNTFTGPVMGRRALLATACGVCVGLVAGCGGGDSDTSASAAGTGTNGATPTSPAPSAQPTAASSPSAATGGASQGLVALSEVPVGGAVTATAADGSQVLVAQPTAGNVVAFSAACPHQGATVEVVGGSQLVCARQGSAFAVTDGAVLQGPAEQGLAAVPVRVDGDQVVAG